MGVHVKIERMHIFCYVYGLIGHRMPSYCNYEGSFLSIQQEDELMNPGDDISRTWMVIQGPHGGRELAQSENMLVEANPVASMN